MHGDIELHVRASDFKAHGHGRDPAYNNVVLHVVFYHDGGPTLLASGSEVPTVALAPWVATRAEELRGWLERPPLWREPCHDAVARLGEEEVGQRLARLGLRRLRQKAHALGKRIDAEGVEDALYRELVEAIGFGPNRAAFRRLAAATSWEAVCGDGFGLAGAATALKLSFDSNARRGAAPEQRLAGAAILLQRLARAGSGSLAAACDGLVRAADDGPALGAGLEVSPYIGASRAAEIAVNVVLPAALVLGVPEVAVAALYETIRDPGSYGLTAYLEGLLRRQAPALVKNAARRQGLLLLQKEYCSQGGCGSCPLS